MLNALSIMASYFVSVNVRNPSVFLLLGMHRKSMEVAQKMVDSHSNGDEVHNNFPSGSSNGEESLRSNSIAALRARALEHSERISNQNTNVSNSPTTSIT